MFKKKNRKFVYLFAALMTVVLVLQYFLPKPTDLSRNYLSKNKSPFGCYAIYQLLGSTYGEVRVNNQTLYNLSQKTGNRSSFLVINDRIDFNRNDIEFMYRYLERGNSVCLAAGNFTGMLSDSLHLTTTSLFYDFSQNLDTLIRRPGTALTFFQPDLAGKKFPYPRLASASYFERFDSTRFKVVAALDNNKACMIKTKIGKGTLYLLSMPDVFGNYFVAGHANREVPYAFLSMLKNDKLVWDEYYKTYNVTNYSPIKFILENDALYAAYLLAILTIVLYMILEGRRRQRAIPVITPPGNSTLQFVNVISHVYFNSNNHRNIGIEKIKYFYEGLRKKFNVNTNLLNEEFYAQVSDLSGIDKKQVKQLFLFCTSVQNANTISEYELIELNRQIHNFNKHSLR